MFNVIFRILVRGVLPLYRDAVGIFNSSSELDYQFFAHSVKQFYLTHRLDPIRCSLSGPEWTLEQWQWKGTPHSPKIQHYWTLTIRLFSLIIRTLIRGGLTPLQKCSRCILQLQPTGQFIYGRETCHSFLL